MNRKLESPSISVYENVNKVEVILEKHIDLDGLLPTAIATDILDEFNIPWGEKKEIKMSEDNVYMKCVDTIIKEGKNKGKIYRKAVLSKGLE